METENEVKNGVMERGEPLIEYRWCENPIILTKEGAYKPENFAKIEEPADILLAGSFSCDQDRGFNTLKRLAQGSSEQGCKPVIYLSPTSISDKINGTDNRLFDDPNPRIQPILKSLEGARNIGFTVFDQDFPFIAYFMWMMANDPKMATKIIYLGGPGVINHFSFWAREILLELKKLPGDLQVVLVRGEADEILGRALNGEENLPGVVKINKHSSFPKTPELATVGCGEDGYLNVPIVNDLSIEKDTSEIINFVRGLVMSTMSKQYKNNGEFIRRLFEIREMFKDIMTQEFDKSRGCNKRCRYCSQGNIVAPVRQLSPQSVIEQFREYLSKGKLYFTFSDDDTFIDKKWWMEFIDLLAKTGMDEWTSFSGYSNIESILKYSDEELREMAQSGFREVSLGVQSTNKEELKRMGRDPKSAEKTLAAIKKLSNAGIDVDMDFIELYPGFHRNWFVDSANGGNGIFADKMQFFSSLIKDIGYIPEVRHSMFVVNSQDAQRRTIDYTEKVLGIPFLDSLSMREAISPVGLSPDLNPPARQIMFGKYGSTLVKHDGKIIFEEGRPWDKDSITHIDSTRRDGPEAIIKRIQQRATGNFPDIEKMAIEMLRFYVLSTMDLSRFEAFRENLPEDYEQYIEDETKS